MYYPRKLKPDEGFRAFIPAIIAILIFIIFSLFYGVPIGLLAIAGFFLLYSIFSLISFFRTRNQVYLFGFLFQLVWAYILVTSRFSPFNLMNSRMSTLLAIIGFAIMAYLIYLMITRKGKWKGTEVFELAARSVQESTDGFTARPRYAGKAMYTRNELQGFAEFLRRNLVAMPYREENRIVFIPVRAFEEFRVILAPKTFRQEKSWISFDYDGNVTVFISRTDYLEYQEELSFDQLCENMGNLFISFIDYYNKGEADRIMYKLNELKISFNE